MPGEIDAIAAEIERIRAEYGRREREISSDRFASSQPASLFSWRVRQQIAAPGALPRQGVAKVAAGLRGRLALPRQLAGTETSAAPRAHAYKPPRSGLRFLTPRGTMGKFRD